MVSLRFVSLDARVPCVFLSILFPNNMGRVRR